MAETVFEGRSAEMKKNSKWLASEDLMGVSEQTVTIDGVLKHGNVEFEAGRIEKVVFAIAFQGKEKQLVINATNRRELVRLFGTDVKKWKGQCVKLWVDTNVKMMGKIVCGVRIKEAK